MTAQILILFEIWRFYVFFSSKFERKTQPNLNSSNLYWGAISVYSGVANLASKCDCSNPFIFRDMEFFMIFSCFFIQKNLDIKKIKYNKLTELEFPHPIVGCYQGTFRY